MRLSSDEGCAPTTTNTNAIITDTTNSDTNTNTTDTTNSDTNTNTTDATNSDTNTNTTDANTNNIANTTDANTNNMHTIHANTTDANTNTNTTTSPPASETCDIGADNGTDGTIASTSNEGCTYYYAPVSDTCE